MSGKPTLEQNVDLLIKRLLLKDLRTQCRQRKLSPAGGREQLADRLKEDMLSTQDFTLRAEDGSVMEDAMVSQLFGSISTGKGNNFVRPEGQNVGNFLGDRPSSRVLAAPGGNSNFSLSHDADHVAAPVASPAFHGAQAQGMPQVPEQAPAAPVTAGKLSFLDKMTAKIAAPGGKSAGEPLGTMPPANTMLQDAPMSVQAPPPVAVSVPETAEPVAAVASSAPGVTGIKDNNYSRPSGQNVGNFITDKPSSRVLAPPGGGSALRLG